MQNAELFRRGIVVPLDREAEECLRVSNVDASTNVRYLSIPDNDLFEALWKTGLFQQINVSCASLLDDYEEEMIEATNVPSIIAAIELVAGKADSQQERVAKFLRDAKDLVDEASTSSRPMLFVL